MKNLQYPLNLLFKVTTLSNDFVATDATGTKIAYVRQKMLKLFEEVQVYSNETRAELLYTIKANKWIDFSAAYTFTNASNVEVGQIIRKGWKSLWKASYQLYGPTDELPLQVKEENPWVKVLDNIVGEIPVVGLFTGYILHPRYVVTREDGTALVRLTKESSFFGRRFSVEKLSNLLPDEEERIVLGLMMLILLERQRG